jgi:hypothetical protein
MWWMIWLSSLSRFNLGAIYLPVFRINFIDVNIIE